MYVGLNFEQSYNYAWLTTNTNSKDVAVSLWRVSYCRYLTGTGMVCVSVSVGVSLTGARLRAKLVLARTRKWSIAASRLYHPHPSTRTLSVLLSLPSLPFSSLLRAICTVDVVEAHDCSIAPPRGFP